jgi:hypothetical protein
VVDQIVHDDSLSVVVDSADDGDCAERGLSITRQVKGMRYLGGNRIKECGWLPSSE